MNLDGKDVIKPTPYDAHEQVARAPHDLAPPELVTVIAGKPVVSVHSGLVPLEEGYEHQEYPKAVAHDPDTGEPVIARDADHEAELAEKAEEK